VGKRRVCLPNVSHVGLNLLELEGESVVGDVPDVGVGGELEEVVGLNGDDVGEKVG
jgi:hypothetical protein